MPAPGSKCSGDYACLVTMSGQMRRSSSGPLSTASMDARPALTKASIIQRPTSLPGLPGMRATSRPTFARPCKPCLAPAWRLSVSRTTRTSPTFGPTSSNLGRMVRRNDISFLIADGHARTSRETFRASAARFIGIGRPTSSALIKDVVVNLSGRQDFAADYAVSLGATFGAHLVGIAFIYDPVIPDGALGGIPVDVIERSE